MHLKKMFLCICALALFSGVGAMAGEVELRFSWWGGSARHEATLAAIKLFEEQNPGVTIRAEYMGWPGYLERLTTQIGSGAEPDIVQIDWAWLATFSSDGNGFFDLLTLPDIVNTGAYQQKWIDQTMVKGKLNGLPVSFTTQYFLWNKTVWERAGVPLPKTWDDLAAAGKVFREKLGEDYYCLDMTKNHAVYMTNSRTFQKTGKMFIDPDKPEIALSLDEIEEMLTFYKNLCDSHGMVPLSERAAHTGQQDTPVQEQPSFINGKWAGVYTWDSTLSLTLATPLKEFEFVLGDYLTYNDAKNSGRIGRPAQVMVVSKNSKNPEMAAKFLNFLLTTPEAARILKVTRGVMVADPAQATLAAENLISPIQQEATDQIADVTVYTPSPYIEDPRILKVLNDTLEEVGYGKVTPREGAESLQRQVSRILRRLAAKE